MRKEPVSPHECMLLFGLPLTKEAFLRKLDGPRNGNFAEGFRTSSSELSWSGYQAMAGQLCRTADEAERLGVCVVREMHLAELTRVCESRVVTIISHWRSANFREADLCDASRIAAHFRKTTANGIAAQAEELLGYLNTCLIAGTPEDGVDLGAMIRLQKSLITRRTELTSQIPGAFRGGAGVEFADDFHGIEDIQEQVPPRFSGVFDLTVCNSLLLAEALHLRCPRSLVLSNADVTFPDTRLPFYRATIQLLGARPLAYEDAVNELRRSLRRRFK
jgi:hypothetical protein